MRGSKGGLMAELRFCAYQYQHLPLEVLRQRWLDSESLGFDVLWNCDTVVEPDRARRIAAQHADGWSSWGGYGVETEQDFYTVTAGRSHRFDDLCADLGRDPTTIRHSVVCFPPLTPWESVEYFTDMVGRFAEIGIDEFVLYWPQSWRDAPGEDAVFQEVAATVMPRLRAAG
jgi:hypothetical protein